MKDASSYHARELLYRGNDRPGVLERLRTQVPGFTEERYETALAEAVADLEHHRRRSSERRAKI